MAFTPCGACGGSATGEGRRGDGGTAASLIGGGDGCCGGVEAVADGTRGVPPCCRLLLRLLLLLLLLLCLLAGIGGPSTTTCTAAARAGAFCVLASKSYAFGGGAGRTSRPRGLAHQYTSTKATEDRKPPLLSAGSAAVCSSPSSSSSVKSDEQEPPPASRSTTFDELICVPAGVGWPPTRRRPVSCLSRRALRCSTQSSHTRTGRFHSQGSFTA